MTTICQMIKIIGGYNNAIRTNEFIPTFENLPVTLKLNESNNTENTSHVFFSTYTAYFKTIRSHLSATVFFKLSIFIMNFFYWKSEGKLYIIFFLYTFQVYYLRQKYFEHSSIFNVKYLHSYSSTIRFFPLK